LSPASPPARAQNLALKSGSLDFLKGETVLNVEYCYDGMAVGKFANEQDYLDKKVAELNQKKPGRGDRWREAWKANRITKFKPMFEACLNGQLEGRRMALRARPCKEAAYTLVLRTTRCEPGGMMAMINAEAVFVETQNRARELAVVTITKSRGRATQGDFVNVGDCLEQAYGKAGRQLGVLIWKSLK
jgi:hypothetical protein